jgi:hypothetical protein
MWRRTTKLKAKTKVEMKVEISNLRCPYSLPTLARFGLLKTL